MTGAEVKYFLQFYPVTVGPQFFQLIVGPHLFGKDMDNDVVKIQYDPSRIKIGLASFLDALRIKALPNFTRQCLAVHNTASRGYDEIIKVGIDFAYIDDDRFLGLFIVKGLAAFF